MQKKNYLKTFAFFVLLGCNNKSSNSEEDDNFPNSFQYLVGNWRYQNSIWNTSELILRNDSTFQFLDQTCYGRRWTEGRWVKNDYYIGLASFDKYLPQSKSNSELKINNYTDTIPIYFNRTYLYIKDDTLFCADSASYLKNFKFVKSSNGLALLNQK